MATYPLKNISIGGDTYKIAMPPVYVIKCSGSLGVTDWTDWQAGGVTLNTPTLYKDGVQINDWSELTPESNVSFEYTIDDTNYTTFKLSEVSSNPGYGSSSYQFEYISSEAGSIPDSLAYIVRIGFFGGSLTTKKGYRIPLASSGGGGSLVLAAMTSSSLPGNKISFTSASQGTSFYIWVKEDSPVLQSLTDIKTLLADGPVTMVDDSGYVTIGLRDSSTIWFIRPVDDYAPVKLIYCTYSSGTQKWTVSAVKNITVN